MPAEDSGVDVAVDRATPTDTPTPPPDVPPTRCTMSSECDDGIACTEDTCAGDGMCTHTAMNDRCNDGRFCNGVETCMVGRGCVGGMAPACDDMNANTTDRCDDGANMCRNDPVDNDGDGDPAMSAGGRDCDDNDRTRSSLEREVCNGRDDNCNGMVDDGALNSCGNCDPNCRGVSTGGMGGTPFNMGGQRGVEFDPMEGGLLVRAQARTADYLWIPNVNESTLSKWDATTGTEIARYRVGLASGECAGQCCHTSGCNMPSRTVVDGFGDAYVANRAFGMQGTVTKIAADRRDCVDRNGNGMIDTSSGRTDVRPFGQDECVLWTSNVGAANAVLRAVAIDRGDAMAPQGYVWVGSCNQSATARAWKLDPNTGRVMLDLAAPNPAFNCFYGAVGTADGRVWFNDAHQAPTNSLVPINGATGAWGTPVTTLAPSGCRNPYGITADANGRLWLSSPYCNQVLGYDPALNAWSEAEIGTTTGLGITVDTMNNVWTPVYPSGNTLIRFPASAFVAGGRVPAASITRIATSRTFGQVTALGADRGGNMWFTHSDPGTVLVRYNPAGAGTFTNFTGPNRVYTYTDFTGAVRRTVIGTGTYTQDYDTMCDNPTVAELRWDAATPAGTSLNFSVQTAATAAGLGGSMAVPVAQAPRDTSPVDAGARLRTAMVTARRHVRVVVTFNPSTMPIASPVLRSMSISWRCPYNIPGG
ncbi:MAG: hypothetical protein JNK05_19295 [Myxococcales bacterium]|nr:hypothetical protein [Myxococcales bacterium]